MPDPRPSAEPSGSAELRRMVLLLETAAVLEARARRTGDPAQASVLVRRAGQRRHEAARLREQLAARGAALPGRPVQRPASRSPSHGTPWPTRA